MVDDTKNCDDVKNYLENTYPILKNSTFMIHTNKEGKIKPSSVNREMIICGKSLVHSATLTSKAFGSGVLGKYGEYIVAIGLLLFAYFNAIIIGWLLQKRTEQLGT